jgi:integrase
MTQVRLTEVTIRNLPLPERGQRTYLDDSLKGFGVRVSQGGSKTFTLMFGKSRRLKTIGRFGVISLAQARQQAREILAEQTLGIAPEKKAISFRDAVEQFLAIYRAKNKPATANETERLIRRHLIFDSAVSDITTADITKRIDQLSNTPSEQQHAFVAARHLFRWYERRRLISLSPLAGVEAPHRPIPRDRVLDGKELTSVYRARDDLYGDIVRMLILTGQRLGQITYLRPEYVETDTKTISWPASAMKGNRPHTIPYGAMTAEIIEPRLGTGLVFAARGNQEKPFRNFSNAKRQLDEICKLPHWTLHDLRRSVTTLWAALGVPPHVCERMLAHSSGVISGVAAIYNRHSYMDEMREAIACYDAHLVKLIGE